MRRPKMLGRRLAPGDDYRRFGSTFKAEAALGDQWSCGRLD